MKIHQVVLLLLFLTPNYFASEITDAINITKYHNMGFKGQGVKCAIIDSSWDGWSNLETNGVHITSAVIDNWTPSPNPMLPSYTANGHGTSMAIIFHEIAPEAEIYLVRGSTVGFHNGGGLSPNLQTWLQNEHIKIISFSLSPYNVGYPFGSAIFSGTDDFSNALNACVDMGMLVCVIAGNHAQISHFAHLQKDIVTDIMIFPDNNKFIEFTVSSTDYDILCSVQSNQGSTYTVHAINTRTNTNADIALYVNIDGLYYIGGESNLVAQPGDTIRVEFTRTSGVVNKLNVLFNFRNASLKTVPLDSTESIAPSGAAYKAITTGAINLKLFGPGKSNQISSISGWGPVCGDILPNGTRVDGYMKPNLAVGVYGDVTSPTAPTLAGCFAVLASQDLTHLNDIKLFKQTLFKYHVCPSSVAVRGYTMGVTEKTHGIGVLFMDWQTDWIVPPEPKYPQLLSQNPTSLSKQSYLKIGQFNVSVSYVKGNIYTVAGELVKSFSTPSLESARGKRFFNWNLKNNDNEKIAPGIYFLILETNEGVQKTKIAMSR
jgi:hypothetical protein